MKIYVLLLVVSLIGAEGGEHENYCTDLLDFGPREEVQEERLQCHTVLRTVCEEVEQKDCLEVIFFLNCSFSLSLLYKVRFTLETNKMFLSQELFKKSI